MATRARSAYSSEMSRSGRRARNLDSEYDRRSQGYDPYEAAERSSMATGARMYEQFGEDLGDLRGALVGAGRLQSGYGGEDEHDLYEGFEDNLANMLAQNSMRAAGLDLQNIQGIGRMGANEGGEHRALISGQLDREQAERNAQQRKKSSMWGALGSVAGGVGGFLLGGPAGAYLGSQIGGSAGGSL